MSHTPCPCPLTRASSVTKRLEIGTEPDAECLAWTVRPTEGAGKVSPFHEPNRKPTDFSQLILSLDLPSYLPISLLSSSTSALFIASTLISSPWVKYVSVMVEPVSVSPRWTEFALNLRREGSNASTYNMVERWQPWWIDKDNVKGFDLTLFTSTMNLEYTHRRQISCEGSLRIQPQIKQPPRNHCQPYQRHWTDLNWSAQHYHRLFLWSCNPNENRFG